MTSQPGWIRCGGTRISFHEALRPSNAVGQACASPRLPCRLRGSSSGPSLVGCAVRSRTRGQGPSTRRTGPTSRREGLEHQVEHGEHRYDRNARATKARFRSGRGASQHQDPNGDEHEGEQRPNLHQFGELGNGTRLVHVTATTTPVRIVVRRRRKSCPRCRGRIRTPTAADSTRPLRRPRRHLCVEVAPRVVDLDTPQPWVQCRRRGLRCRNSQVMSSIRDPHLGFVRAVSVADSW